MPANVMFPVQLRKLTDNQDSVRVEARTIADMVAELEGRFPGMRERLLDGAGGIRKFVAVYVNGDDVRFLQDLQTPLVDGDEVSIIPAIAGG